jgi:hypothetical protein
MNLLERLLDARARGLCPRTIASQVNTIIEDILTVGRLQIEMIESEMSSALIARSELESILHKRIRRLKLDDLHWFDGADESIETLANSVAQEFYSAYARTEESRLHWIFFDADYVPIVAITIRNK